MNIGRNDLCWCGSGQKYKHCHWNRDRQNPPTLQEQSKTIRASYKKKYCLHPDAGPSCGNIIDAHTIQRNGGLNKIAKDGHVYTFFPEHVTLLKFGNFSARLIGIGQASTFTGFCGYHDNKTFAPIEKVHFLSNAKTSFLLGYRAICRELFGKRAQFELSTYFRNLDKGKNTNEQIEWQDFMDYWEIGVVAGMKWLEHYKSVYDTALLRNDYSKVKYYVVKLKDTPDFMCSGAFLPEYDFLGDKLQNLLIPDRLHDPITFSIIATEKGGAVVFNWIGDNKVCTKLIKSLDSLSDEQIPYAIVRLTFEYFENVFASPVWWDSLDHTVRDNLLKRQRGGGATRATLPNSDYLKDDNVRAISWLVTSRETNIDLK